VRPLIFAQCHKISLGHRSLPFWLQHTMGGTVYQIRCGEPLDSFQLRRGGMCMALQGRTLTTEETEERR
jgi:hypothetical protein